MIDFGKSVKMIRVEKWINQTLTTDLVVIFCSLFKEDQIYVTRKK